jgi:hypothetical protein
LYEKKKAHEQCDLPDTKSGFSRIIILYDSAGAILFSYRLQVAVKRATEALRNLAVAMSSYRAEIEESVLAVKGRLVGRGEVIRAKEMVAEIFGM